MHSFTLISRLFTFFIITMMVGCGFQLRGVEHKPEHLKSIYVTGQGEYSNFMRELKQKLSNQGVVIVDNAQAADLTLYITSNNDERRTLTITRSDRTDEFQLISTVGFKVATASGSEVLPDKKIIVERTYVYDRDKIIGTEYEQDILEKEMDQDIISQIITRLYNISEEDIANAKTPVTTTPDSKTNPHLHNVINQQY